jgi:nuclear transcription factor Y gamma
MDPQYAGPSRHDPSQQPQHQAPPPQAPQSYDTSVMGHYGASAALVANSAVPQADIYSGAFTNVSQGLHGHYRDILTAYWQHTINQLENEEHDYKVHQLPLARIKKVMKADPEVKMISAEAPILFAKGCDIFITELTMRAWIHAEENKRRTLQRSDIASALTKSDMFDFLIDIVPREEAAHPKRSGGASGSGPSQHHQPPPQAQPPQHQQQSPPPQAQPPQHQQPPHPQPIPQEYLGHPGMPQDPNRYDQGSIYGGGGVPTAPVGYPPHQMYAEGLEGMYGYPPQPMYQLPNQRGHLQDPQGSGGNEPGDIDPDAEGERDYEVP